MEKNIKSFNEIVHGSINEKSSNLLGESPKKMEKLKNFSHNRLEGASKITSNAQEKGGDAMLTYHHFRVKLPYYKKAEQGKFDFNSAKFKTASTAPLSGLIIAMASF